MSNNQFKKVSSVLRDSGIRCPTMGYYYERKKEFCMDIMECISVSLGHRKEKNITMILRKLLLYDAMTSVHYWRDFMAKHMEIIYSD